RKAADFTPAAFQYPVVPVSMFATPISIYDTRTGGSPEHSPYGIRHGNHRCRSRNGWGCWDRNACDHERPHVLYPTPPQNPFAHPYYHTYPLCGPIYRPSDPASGHPGDPSDHPTDPDPIPNPNPAPGR